MNKRKIYREKIISYCESYLEIGKLYNFKVPYGWIENIGRVSMFLGAKYSSGKISAVFLNLKTGEKVEVELFYAEESLGNYDYERVIESFKINFHGWVDVYVIPLTQ